MGGTKQNGMLTGDQRIYIAVVVVVKQEIYPWGD
jgi:hypothetical protein